MMALVVAGTCLPWWRAGPAWPGCGTRVHTIPDDLATSVASDPRHQLLGFLDLDGLAVLSHRLPPTILGIGSGLLGSPVGNRNSDRRAQGNSARPCCQAPAPDCITASNDQGCVGVGGQPGPFSHLRGVPPGYLD